MAAVNGRLTFLGSGDSQGVPRWWCTCEVCREARQSGTNARRRPSALLEAAGERVLIDAAPEARLQLSEAGVRGLDAVLITHAHNDHLLGLGDVADMARWTGGTVPVYAPREVLPQVRERFAYLTRGRYPERVPLRALEDDPPLLAGWRVRPHRVPHGFNGTAYGFRFERPGTAWGYLPDSLDLDDLEPWRGLSLWVLGTSHRRERAARETRSVYDVAEAEALVARVRPARTVLTHLSHGVDVRDPAPAGMAFAADGMMVEIP